MIFVGLGAQKNHPFLTMTNGMAVYGGAMLLIIGGLTLFFKNLAKGFDITLFWRRKPGKEHTRDDWVDKNIWRRSKFKTKDAERYGTLRSLHPAYLPFDCITPWLEDLATKYKDKQMERPEWLENDTFVKRAVTIFLWYGKDQERADKALVKLFGRSGRDLEVGADGQLSYIKTSLMSRSLSSLLGGISEGGGKGNKAQPERERGVELGT